MLVAGDMKLEQLNALYKAGLDVVTIQLKEPLKLFRKDITKLSIGAFLDTQGAGNLKDMYSIVAHDLNVFWMPESAKCKLIQDALVFIEQMCKAFENIERMVIIPQSYANEWNTASSKVKVPVPISLIDRLAKRNNISWDEASKLPVTQVVLMLTIDRREEYFNYLVTQKQKTH